MAIFGRRFPIRGITIIKQPLSGGTTYDVDITEAATATETEDATKVLSASITEAATATETESVALVTLAAITESASATETESAVLVQAADITESATATETQDATLITLATITESANATDLTDATIINVADIIESCNAGDISDATITPHPTPIPEHGGGEGGHFRDERKEAEEAWRKKLLADDEEIIPILAGWIIEQQNKN